MKTSLYLFNSGKLERKQNTLRFINERQKRYIPVTTLQDLHLFGEVDINTSALNFLSQHGISLHSYNYYNSYTGSYLPRKRNGNGQLTKLKQVETYLNNKKRLELAKLIIRGAIDNLIKVLTYYDRRAINVKAILTALAKQKQKIPNAKSTQSLMAIEGGARNQYYAAWDAIIQNDNFPFEKRTRQPPQNRLNALISFGNMLLYSNCLSEIYATSLDPGISFLHATNERNYSLNLDIAELFKPIIVDRVIFSLIRNKRLKANQFKKSKQGPRLTDDARELFLSAYNDRLKDTLKTDSKRPPASYRTLIRRECYKLEKHFLEGEPYKPFVLNW